ncbi:MAG: branched-chain amino acid ABC transporter permease [Gammaproteobacteria bacterium]
MPNRPLAVRYEDDFSLLAGRWERIGLALLAVIVIAYPFVASTNWVTVANLALVAVVGSVALMILTGFTGQISLGHAAFLAIGAYTTAILGTQFALPFWLLLPVAGLAAAAVGLAIGPFALRLEGLYLAIVTIGLAFLTNHVLLSLPQWTGGMAGLAVPVHLGFGGSPAYLSERALYAIFLVIAALTVLAARNLARSNTGRAMMAVRDHDVAAAVMGVNPARTKIISFGLSSFFAGVAGGMFALQQQFITVDPPFNLLLSVQYIAMIVLGGIGTVFGAVAGALAFVFLSPLLEIVGRATPGLDQLSSSLQSTLLFALLVIGTLVYEPLGLYGLWLRAKRYSMAWPFRY